jgi:adenylate cyclase
MLLEFPSAVAAVECAIAVQRLMAERNAGIAPDKQMLLRIGINIGDVLIEGDDILGDGVNIAARLEGIAEPGAICLSADAYRQVKGKVDFTVQDLGHARLKNIEEPVRVYALPRPTSAGVIRAAPEIWALPDKPSVAVLPFAYMSSEPEQEFLADGFAEEVITALSRFPSLFVIALNSTFTYKGRIVDVRQVGRELGVRYVLQGSLRKYGSRIRVTGRLIEAESGKKVWADRYDRNLGDIFAVQDEISEAATIAIAPAIADAEQQRAIRRLPESLDTWAAYQRGLWHLSKFTADDNAAAEKFFERAIELDSNFGGGYWGLAKAKIISAAIFQTRGLTETLISAEALARHAVALDRGDAEARSWLGHILFMSGDAEGALAEIERALAMSPNLASGYGSLGDTLTSSGRPREGLAALRQYLRLDPKSPMMAVGLQQMAAAHYFCREYEATVVAAKRVIRSYPDHPLSHRWLAAALGQLDRNEEARRALDRAMARAPTSFDVYIRGRPPWWRPEDQAHVLEGLRKAGWAG